LSGTSTAGSFPPGGIYPCPWKQYDIGITLASREYEDGWHGSGDASGIEVVISITVTGDPANVKLYFMAWGYDDHREGNLHYTDSPYSHITETIPLPIISANIDVDPNALNLRSEGKWITCFIELPEGYNIDDIDVSSILLNDSISVDPTAPTSSGDYDNDTVPDLMVKFARDEVALYISEYISNSERFTVVTLTLTGNLHTGAQFMGSDTIKVIHHDAFTTNHARYMKLKEKLYG